MAYTNPAISDFKLFFVRDFPYGTDANVAVLDADITKAFSFVDVNMNQGLFGSQASYNVGYLLLSAHYLVMNMRASSQGLSGQFNFLQQSKSVGSVAEAFGIPQRVLDNPDWSILCKTNYGAQFIQLVLPQLAGQIYTVCGGTQP